MKTYIAIDLKSFYASVECVERGFDPLTTNLVVADESRTEKTICLAVSPSLKSYGISGRARLYEVVQKVRDINYQRLNQSHVKKFEKSSYYNEEVKSNPDIALDYYVASPRMAYYMKYSTKIYNIYLKYVSSEDIVVYSIDEVFMDVTNYLKTYNMDGKQLAMTIIKDVLEQTGITATAGVATNLFLCKVAMDIVAKRIPADENGVRIAQLDEQQYRQLLWNHQPLTDFWRIGKGISKKLNEYGMYTMGDIARMSLKDEAKLFKLFGVNAELIIDHAWGYEPTEIKDIKAYKPQTNSLQSGQVLPRPYSFEKGLLVVKEMCDNLVLDIVEKGLKTNLITLMVGYDISSLEGYEGEIKEDFYGRKMPKMAHGSVNLNGYTSSSKQIVTEVSKLYRDIVDSSLKVRKMYVCACNLKKSEEVKDQTRNIQIDLFNQDNNDTNLKAEDEKETSIQQAIIKIQKKYGKNAVLKGNNLEEGATSIERHKMIGGHKA